MLRHSAYVLSKLITQAFRRIRNYAFHFNCLLVTKLLRSKMENLSELVGFVLTVTTLDQRQADFHPEI